jgi:hypothetical protein
MYQLQSLPPLTTAPVDSGLVGVDTGHGPTS